MAEMASANKQIFILENLNCANCAAKIEDKIKEMPEVHSATFAFMTKQLRVVTTETDSLIHKIQEICDSIEDGVKVLPGKMGTTVKKEESKASGECCGGHDHSHVHGDHAHGHSHEHGPASVWDMMTIIFGIAVLLVSSFTDLLGDRVKDYALLLAYLLLGWNIIKTAVKNLFKGQIFDENFLMTIATLGAVAINEYPEALGVILFYRIGEYFEHKATERNRSQIMETLDLRPEVVNLVVGEEVRVIPAEEAKIGDIVVIRVGDRIPLDGTIIEGSTRLDTSAITGEPVPVSATIGDAIFSGCVNTAGVIKIRVDKVLAESMVSRILEAVETAAANKPAIDRFITRFARIYTPIVVAVAILTALIPGYITGDWKHWTYTALTFLVISCPCALVLSVPLAFFSGIGAGAKQGILFKGGLSIDAIKNVKAIAFDKTGTITEGNFVVQKITALGNYKEEEVLSLCAAGEVHSTHPIAVSIVEAAKKQNITIPIATNVSEIAGEGVEAVVGSKTVLVGNERLMERFNVELPAMDEAVGSQVLVAVDNVFVGRIVISDTIKADAKAAIEQIKSMGIKTALFTGDNEKTANYVATQTGVEQVAAKLLPEEKLTEVQKLRRNGSVMFVGDGINDAPVLAGADVGGAMGSGADAAIEAADVVFMTPKFMALPKAISLAKLTGAIAWQNVVLALGVKVVIMLLGLLGYASMWAAVFADTGVTIICILNSIRILYKKI